MNTTTEATAAALPVVQPQAPVSAPIPSSSRPEITALRGNVLFTFGRRDNTYLTYDFAVNITAQNTLSGRTYDQIQELVSADLPITRDNFIRMWKTLILKRCLRKGEPRSPCSLHPN